MVTVYEYHEITKEEAKKIIETRYPEGLFYHKDGNKYIGIDNSSGDAWTEEFDNLDICLEWLKGEIDTEEAYRLDKEVMNE
jgi:hypothetical protein